MALKHISALLLIASTLACTQAESLKANKTWQASARASGLSAADISSLEKNRILITNEAYKQCFSPYLSGSTPFITSDSLLNAYHVLYEESIFRLESKLATQLPEILEFILKNLEDTDDSLRGNPALISAAKKRSMLVIGVALRLMNDSFRFEDESLNTILDQETKRIMTAKGVEMPSWLGKPNSSFLALDYSRYTPRGFYSQSEQLKCYFRAVSWLHSIPFRVKNNEELLAILMLGNSIKKNSSEDYTEEIYLFFHAYNSFIGSSDDWDLMTAVYEAPSELVLNLDHSALQYERSKLIKRAKEGGKESLINDQIRYAPDDPKKVEELNFRIISAYRTPSAILFQKTTDLRQFKRPYPDGLEIAASLGSTFARKNLHDPQKKDLLKTIDTYQTHFQGNSLYFAYLDALKALLDAPEPDAPDFMKSEAWQIKSCNTALAGWAQLRHTWALQAKQIIQYRGETTILRGFVEPEPEFFSRMATLADKTSFLLKESGAFDPNYTRTIQHLEEFKGFIKGVKSEQALQAKFYRLSAEEMSNLGLAFILIQMNPSEVGKEPKAYFKEKTQQIDTLVADIKQGRIDNHPEAKRIIERNDKELDLEQLWQRFEKISRRLEIISHKQLRGADLNPQEIYFIKNYGKAIAGIMLYGGNSYLTPKDDAARIVDVFTNSQQGGYLHVGISRPRKLYVLYPWKGETILCEGAIMPYYEFVTTTRLTDESWKENLDSKNRPSLPKWITPIVSDQN